MHLGQTMCSWYDPSTKLYLLKFKHHVSGAKYAYDNAKNIVIYHHRQTCSNRHYDRPIEF